MVTDDSCASVAVGPPIAQRQELIVPSDAAGQRLDKYLAGQIADTSRATIQKWIEEGRVVVDGRTERAGLRLAAGQSIVVRTRPQPSFPTLAQNIPLSVLYEDEVLAVIDKPAGMVVHPAAGHWEGTLVNALMARYPALQESAEASENAGSDAIPRPGIVHRLDKDTSGIIIVAKSTRIAELLQAQFHGREVHKTYLALVRGTPSATSGLIDAPIGRDPRQRKRMMVTPEGRPAQTHYRVIQLYPPYALLEVQPRTGRTHQIRVHLAFIGHPVAGDETYGWRRDAAGFPRQFLHAWRIEFRHPLTGATITVEAPLPPDLRQTLDALSAPGIAQT